MDFGRPNTRRQTTGKASPQGTGILRLGITLVFATGLSAQPRVTVDRLDLHQYEDGPVLAASYEFLPGETVWFSGHFGGFHTENQDNERHVKLSWQMQVTDPAGVLVEKPRAGRIEDRLLPEDKEWRPKFLANFQIPPFAIGGIYKIPVAVKDELSGAEASRILEFPVKGPPLPAATALAVHNFRFLRNEDDALPLRPAVYRPGSMLWARFDLAGYQLSENNRFDVNYGLAVLGAEGQQLFTEPEAAAEAKESFYPQRWVPGALRLNLDPNVPAAAYTLVVIARDKLSGQTTELREPFRVE